MSQSPSRRDVLAGAAWSVPILALAVATPLAAASAPALQAEFVAVAVDTTPNTYQASWGSANPNRDGPAVYAGEPIRQSGTIQNVGNATATLAGNGAQVSTVFVSASPTGGRVFWSEPTLSAASIAAGWTIISRRVNVVTLSYFPALAPGEIAPAYELTSIAQNVGPGWAQATGGQQLTVIDPMRAEPSSQAIDGNGRPGTIFSPRPGAHPLGVSGNG